MTMDIPDVTAFLAVASVALLFAELQYRRQASSRWFILATLWIIAVGMLIYLYAE